jgi:hypothetical protein
MSQAVELNTLIPSRRALLASAPAVAAVALAGSTVANAVAIGMAKADGLDWPAIILRAEEVVERLKKYYGSEWTAADQEAAAGMLKYCGEHAPEDDEAGWDATLSFFEHYNCSFDWVYRGDPVTMIAAMADCSPRGRPAWASGADPIFDLIEAHRAAVTAVN